MKRLLIIGAGFLQSFFIKKAKSKGVYTIALDGNPNAVGFEFADKHSVIDITNKELCLSFATKEKIDGVVTVATDYGVLTAAYIANHLNLPGLNYNVAELVKDKYRVRELFNDFNVDDTGRAFEISNIESALTISKALDYPVMVKPCDGSGSRGASRVDSCDELIDACQIALQTSLSHKAVVEHFIVGKEYGAESFVYNGQVHVLAIIRKWMTNPPFYAELGHAIPTDLSSEIENKAKQCVCKAIYSLGINYGSVNMDMIITDQGDIHIVDVGARMGGNMIGSHIIPLGTGIDYMSLIIDASINNNVKIEQNKCGIVATRIIALKEGVLKEMPDIEKIEKKYNVTFFHHMSKGMHVNEYHTNLDGLGYIISNSNNVNDAISSVKCALEECETFVAKQND